MSGSVRGQIVINATLEAAQGSGGELAALLRDTQRACRDEPGCIAYRMMRDLDASDRFHVFEIWRDEAALHAHAAAPAFRAFLDGLAALGRVVGSDRWIGTLSPYDFNRTQELKA